MDQDKRYKKIALYSLGVILISAIIIMGVFANMDFGKYLGILYPFFYAFAIAYVLDSVVGFFRKVMMKAIAAVFGKTDSPAVHKAVKYFSIALAYTVFILILYLFSIVMFPQLYASLMDLFKNYQEYIDTGYKWFRGFVTSNEILNNILYSGAFDGMLTGFTDKLISFLGEFSPKALAFVERFANEVKNIIFGIFISIYMLIGKETFKAQTKKLLTAFLSKKNYGKVTTFCHECDYRFGGFIVGKIIDSTIIGLLCYICCIIFKFPFAALISFIVGVTNIIPIAGPFIGAVPSAFLILLTEPDKVIWFLLFILVLQQLDGNFIGPMILGDKTGLSAFWVLVALIIMGGLYGIIGMVLAVPICSVIYYEIKIVAERKLAMKGLPTDTAEYVGENERMFVSKAKDDDFSARVKKHIVEIEMIKKEKKDAPEETRAKDNKDDCEK